MKGEIAMYLMTGGDSGSETHTKSKSAGNQTGNLAFEYFLGKFRVGRGELPPGFEGEQ